jgi:enoyl-CoA hydratase
MVLGGRLLTAEEALAHGLCSQVVATEELHEKTVALATAIATRPPGATRLAKRAVADAYETTLAEGVRREQVAFAEVFATADASEGIAAFVEKRDPRWTFR